jgi:hypothetical protein
MASTYTTRIGLEKQGDGENANTWGLRLNQNVIDLVDEAIAGYETVNVSAASSVVLTDTDGASNQARNFGLKFTGELTADTTVTIPAEEKIYFVKNDTTGDYSLILKPAGGTATTAVGSGNSMIVATDGATVDKFVGGFEAGTRMLFQQSTAPIGWTAVSVSSYDDVALRIVAPDTYTTAVGGTNIFSSVFNTNITVTIADGTAETATLTGSTSVHVLTTAQIPSHNHSVTNYAGVSTNPDRVIASLQTGESGATTGFTGGGQGHSHSLAGLGSHSHTVSVADSLINFDVKYVNFIIAQKD